jgi:hypothetical protein
MLLSFQRPPRPTEHLPSRVGPKVVSQEAHTEPRPRGRPSSIAPTWSRLKWPGAWRRLLDGNEDDTHIGAELAVRGSERPARPFRARASFPCWVRRSRGRPHRSRLSRCRRSPGGWTLRDRDWRTTARFARIPRAASEPAPPKLSGNERHLRNPSPAFASGRPVPDIAPTPRSRAPSFARPHAPCPIASAEAVERGARSPQR